MSKSDKEIWLETLEVPEMESSFTVKPGGIKVKSLPKPNIFKSQKERKLEERVVKLEKQVKILTEELTRVSLVSEAVKRRMKSNEYNKD